MRYLGGKAKIAKRLAPKIAAAKVWEPFAGGLNMSRALDALGCELWLSDAHPSLAPLYRAVQRGWVPPEAVSSKLYRAARQLPDAHPFKAFAGFGMSYGGKWFGGYAGSQNRRAFVQSRGCECAVNSNPARATARSLEWLRSSSNVRAIFTANFFDVPVRRTNITIYCDPPYEGATGYGCAFDSARFWKRCQEWSRAGARVLVSEHACPIPHLVRFELQRGMLVHKKAERVRTERLFEVLRGLKAAFGGHLRHIA